MHISEVCNETGLTKKAIGYYIEKGLLKPDINENQYRSFSDNDISTLKKIAFYRKLELNISEINKVITGNEIDELSRILILKKEKLNIDVEKNSIMEEYVSGNKSSAILKLEHIEKNKTIKEKLLECFPGYFGRYITIHFSNFLNEPISTSDQEEAYDIIIKFLDNVDKIEFPERAKEFIDEMSSIYDNNILNSMSENYMKTVDQDFDSYWKENEDTIKEYYEIKQTDEYKESEAAEFQSLMKVFYEESGYYDILIPAMKKLSPSYLEFNNKLNNFSKKLIKVFPEVIETDKTYVEKW